jgi:hypothetical protein
MGDEPFQAPERSHRSNIEVRSLALPLVENAIHLTHHQTLSRLILISSYFYLSRYQDSGDISGTAERHSADGKRTGNLGQHLHRHDPIVASGVSTEGGYAAGLAGGPDTSRRCPPSAAPEWLGRIFILGALNFTLFWAALFISAYRLPGGVAATLGATQPLIVLLLSRPILCARIEPVGLCAALAGIVGVGLLILGPQAMLDPIGAAAALVGALSMSASGSANARGCAHSHRRPRAELAHQDLRTPPGPCPTQFTGARVHLGNACGPGTSAGQTAWIAPGVWKTPPPDATSAKLLLQRPSGYSCASQG